MTYKRNGGQQNAALPLGWTEYDGLTALARDSSYQMLAPWQRLKVYGRDAEKLQNAVYALQTNPSRLERELASFITASRINKEGSIGRNALADPFLSVLGYLDALEMYANVSSEITNGIKERLTEQFLKLYQEVKGVTGLAYVPKPLRHVHGEAVAREFRRTYVPTPPLRVLEGSPVPL